MSPGSADCVPLPIDVRSRTDQLVRQAIRSDSIAAGLDPTQIDSLISNSISHPVVRFAHQPNLFPYAGFLVQLIFLDAVSIASSTEWSPFLLYLAVDHDSSADARFKRARYPTRLGRDGYLSISTGSGDQTRAMFADKPPSSDEVLGWFLRIESDVKSRLTRGSERLRVLDRLTHARTQAVDACVESSSLVDFNLRSLVSGALLPWATDILVVRTSSLLSVYESVLRELAQFSDLLRDTVDDVYEDSRTRRYPVSSVLDRPNPLSLWSICRACGLRAPTEVVLEDVADVDPPSRCCDEPDSYWSSSILLDNICEYTVLKPAAGAAYLPAVDHLGITGLVCERLGWHAPFDVAWRPKACYGPSCHEDHSNRRGALAENLRHDAKASWLYHACEMSISQFRDWWLTELLDPSFDATSPVVSLFGEET